MEIWGRGAFQAEGNSTYKGLGQASCLACWRNSARRLVWLEQSEQGGERRRAGRWRRSCRSCGLQENLGFYPEGDGALKCCRQRGNLNQMLTGILWMLLSK